MVPREMIETKEPSLPNNFRRFSESQTPKIPPEGCGPCFAILSREKKTDALGRRRKPPKRLNLREKLPFPQVLCAPTNPVRTGRM